MSPSELNQALASTLIAIVPYEDGDEDSDTVDCYNTSFPIAYLAMDDGYSALAVIQASLEEDRSTAQDINIACDGQIVDGTRSWDPTRLSTKQATRGPIRRARAHSPLPRGLMSRLSRYAYRLLRQQPICYVLDMLHGGWNPFNFPDPDGLNKYVGFTLCSHRVLDRRTAHRLLRFVQSLHSLPDLRCSDEYRCNFTTLRLSMLWSGGHEHELYLAPGGQTCDLDTW
nr:hypothetical protein CFP56_36239 [Quercus suber]